MTREEYQAIYDVVGVAMEVHATLGRGLAEPVYQEAFAIEMRLRDMEVQREKVLQMHYKGVLMEKTYIADFYGNPRHLYRLEIRLTSDEIFRYFKKYDVSPSVDLLINQDYLKSMYDELLFRMLHFTYKRKTIGLLDAVTAIKEGYDLDVLI